MNQFVELPHDIDMEKDLLSALLVRNGEAVPAVNAIVSPDDFYRPEHRIIFQIILRLFSQGIPPNILSIIEEFRKTDKLKKIELSYLLSIAAMSFTNAYAEVHARTVKEKSDLRRVINTAQVIIDRAQKAVCPPSEIIADAQRTLEAIQRSVTPSQTISFSTFFADKFNATVETTKAYANRKTGFDNLDAQQFFLPGLYVIGATPAAGKTTFCWQLLEQLARNGETCIFCSYEMSKIELFAKSLARELFRRNPLTALTAAQIRRGGASGGLREVLVDFARSGPNLSVLELQDESVDDLLKILRPLCSDKTKAPVVCLDYLQIMPTAKESTKLGIDETVRKLKKFQRDTNTTFIVISSFNRVNYAQAVSFESFKESGNIEYTADVVWALQLDIMNQLQSLGSVSEARKKIDAAKKQQPRKIQLRCLKNRHGTNYDCFFEYHSAHDCFIPYASFDETVKPPKKVVKK